MFEHISSRESRKLLLKFRARATDRRKDIRGRADIRRRACEINAAAGIYSSLSLRHARGCNFTDYAGLSRELSKSHGASQRFTVFSWPACSSSFRTLNELRLEENQAKELPRGVGGTILSFSRAPRSSGARARESI